MPNLIKLRNDIEFRGESVHSTAPRRIGQTPRPSNINDQSYSQSNCFTIPTNLKAGAYVRIQELDGVLQCCKINHRLMVTHI